MYYPHRPQINHLLRAASVIVWTKLIIRAAIQKRANGLAKDVDGFVILNHEPNSNDLCNMLDESKKSVPC
jgi:hypothetical protein